MKNPIKLSLRSELPIIILLLIGVLASFWFYQNMPEQVPIHWNFAGEPDNYGSRTMAAFFFPALIVGIYLLMIFLPYLDPKKERYQQFVKAYWAIRLILVIYFILIYFSASLVGVGYKIPISQVVLLGVGILFIIIGNYLGKIKPNWFVGIRTPWTLSNEEVWNKTHRLGGKLFILAGLFFIFSIFIPVSWSMLLLLIIIGLVVIGTIVYSYWLYRQLEKNKS